MGAPLYHRHYTPGHQQFITTSIYRRVQLFRSERLARHFVDVLRELRRELDFALVVVPPCGIMPEHFHVLVRPEPRSFARHLPLITRHCFVGRGPVGDSTIAPVLR
ncbi:MAG: hypothetical protein ABSB82_01775 [Terriglobia bacterium]